MLIQCDAHGDLCSTETNTSVFIQYISACRCVSHLYSRTDWCEGIHLGEADCLAVHSRGLLNHDGGAGLALRPGRRRGVGWFGLMMEHIKRDRDIQNELTNKVGLYYFNCLFLQQQDTLT